MKERSLVGTATYACQMAALSHASKAYMLVAPATPTSSSGFVHDPPPHITATLYTTADGDHDGLEMELEVEPSAFLHTSSSPLTPISLSKMADPEFQAFLVNAWVSFQAGKGKADQFKGKKVHFDGVEVPQRKVPRVTVKEEIESPAVHEAHTPAARRPSPLSQAITPEDPTHAESSSSSSRMVILSPQTQRAPGEGQPIAKPMPTTTHTSPTSTTTQREPNTSDDFHSMPTTPATALQPTAPSSANNGQFCCSFPLADSEALKSHSSGALQDLISTWCLPVDVSLKMTVALQGWMYGFMCYYYSISVRYIKTTPWPVSFAWHLVKSSDNSFT
ncbi:hypothetical protein BDN67DRAFT_985576 [Paxillus ammoniavirescens]|nr:hypothetical protein BDN67DRAFT_985576 [Paxillus ammoniavirescens]